MIKDRHLWLSPEHGKIASVLYEKIKLSDPSSHIMFLIRPGQTARLLVYIYRFQSAVSVRHLHAG